MSILPKRRIPNPATQQEIATTNRNTRKAYSLIAATLIPFPAYGLLSKVIGRSTAMGAKKMGDNIRFTKGMTMSGIKSAFKKAGSIGNTKKPDTVGNRMRQSQSILGVRKDESGTRIAKHYGSKSPTSYTGGVIGTFKERKIGRTIQKAVEQGPSKFFSSGRSAKTGITPFKRAKDRFYIYGNLSTKEIKAQAKASRSTSKGSLLFENKVLKKSVEDANKKAREALKKK